MSSVLQKPEIEARVVRKVARRLIPFLGLAYFVNYLDRTNIGLAKLTMSEELGLTETMFGLASGLFFIGYLLFEVPSNLALHRFGARRWIARIMLTWGIIAAAMAFVPNAGSLYTLRMLLGIAEAGFFPGVLLYLTLWFPRAYRVRLMGLFLLALPVSSALGAPLSSAIIQYWDGLFGLSGWRVMFLLEGIPAVVLAVVTWFYLTDRPSQATWLDEDEKVWLTRELESEACESGSHISGSVRRAVTDSRVGTPGGDRFPRLDARARLLRDHLRAVLAQFLPAEHRRRFQEDVRHRLLAVHHRVDRRGPVRGGCCRNGVVEQALRPYR